MEELNNSVDAEAILGKANNAVKQLLAEASGFIKISDIREADGELTVDEAVSIIQERIRPENILSGKYPSSNLEVDMSGLSATMNALATSKESSIFESPGGPGHEFHSDY
jgi:hypothetical protein